MISYIRGPLMEADEDVIVVEAGNVGYNIHVPLSLLETLPPPAPPAPDTAYSIYRSDAFRICSEVISFASSTFRTAFAASTGE